MSHRHDHGGGTAKAATVTLLVDAAITAAKWIAFAATGSPSLFGEAAHSSADTLNPILLWFGHRRSERPSDAHHPFGHGREAFFWSLVAAVMMLTVGATLTAANGIETIVHGTVPRRSMLAVIIMACAAVGEGYSLLVVWRELRGEGTARAAVADSRNTVLLALAVENGIDILGIMLGFAGYGLYLLTGNPLWDAGFSLAIACVLALSSLFLINRSRSLIVGETAPADIDGAIVAVVRGRPSVAEVRSVVAVMRGPHDIGCHVTIRWDPVWYGRRSDDEAQVISLLALIAAENDGIRADIAAAVPEITHVDIDVVAT